MGLNDDAELAQELERLERALLDPETRRDGTRVAALLAESFREFGSSGRVWDREETIAVLAAEHTPAAGHPREADKITMTNFAMERLSAEAALVTYLSERGGRRALRSSVWVRRQGGWQMLFHQGTPLAG